MYPNPAMNYVVFETNTDELVSMCLYNIQGKLVWKENIYSTATIDVNHLSKGIYIVRMEGLNSLFVTKLVIE